MEAAVRRANLYADAGADAIFPEALTSAAEFREMASSIKAPLLANMTEFGKTPYYTADEFQMLGCSMVIYPVTSLRAAAKAYERVFAEIFEKARKRVCSMTCRHAKNYMMRFITTTMKNWTKILPKRCFPKSEKNTVDTRNKAAE